MSSEFERLEQLFHAAEALAPEERRGYLDGLDTEDSHLRADLEELLDMRSVASDFFEGETGPAGAPGRVVGSIGPGDVIGEFEITGVIASGGMGTVYTARQARPRRTVALKVIRGDVATASTLERFELEAEILGSLEHPGIARIFAAGVHAAESGDVPWFAMEFIDGVSLTEYADRHGLDQRARLELFCDVCDAASHAHRRGIIHRDLKPQNILVGADGVAKILDFGVARVSGDDLQLATIEADLGRIVGTLAYMSPEQTLADPHAIDTRSDIYALGAILHELLCGQRPFDLRDEPLPDAVAIIRDVEAPLLGTIDPRLRGDLEVIVAHALEKERTRRYGSSGEFAADVRRHLDDQPILARPAGAAYRLRKFVRRNPALTIAVAGIVVAMIAGILGTVAGLREARTESKLKDRAIADYERMSDVERLDSALEEARAMWPLHADLVPLLERWQRRYGAVFERLPVHEATLERLREQAEAYDEPERRRDFAVEYGLLDFLEQERTRLEEILDEGEAGAAESRLEKVLSLSESRAEALRRDLESRRRWSFGDDVDRQFLHDTLESLVARLRTALDPDPRVGVVADIARRLERARRIESETVTSCEEAWRDAAARVAADDRFGGFELRPIMGLVPLGADPVSGLEEFLHWASHEGVVPRRDAGRVTITGATGLILVLVPGGRFVMGAQNTERSRPHFDASATRNEMPPCEVELAPFMISKYEMTQAQWKRTEGENPSYYVAGKTYRPGKVTGLHPVESVDHPTVTAALKRLGLALPTDAQWERAARAGTESIYYTGGEVRSLAGHANLADEGSDGYYPPSRANISERDFDDGHAMHAPVGSFRPNGYGLHDIHGNVFEWCRDIRTLTLHPLIHYVRPGDGLRSPADSDPRFMVVRGGAFTTAAVSARIAGRGTHERSHTSYGLGCRPARPATP